MVLLDNISHFKLNILLQIKKIITYMFYNNVGSSSGKQEG